MEPEGAQVPSSGEAAQSSTEEPRGSPAETAPCPVEMPPEPEAEPQAGATVPVELPPCHGVPGPYLGGLPAVDLQPLPLCVPEPPREPPTRGQCLMHNWQEERATNDLDLVPRPECGTEGSFHRHGHPGLLTLDFLAGMPTTTTMKDSYPRPVKTGLPVRGGQRDRRAEAWSGAQDGLSQQHLRRERKGVRPRVGCNATPED
ncbi:sperm-associated antigen 8-like [Crotalus tigris]|uniref:sperm-associated antigen 8-like n=1 Tax=Crotalus tigris TaxID=88082 RepID=UPI00192F6D85|nr:sperm-associated antigen 8-like [Crotalus tigris]